MYVRFLCMFSTKSNEDNIILIQAAYKHQSIMLCIVRHAISTNQKVSCFPIELGVTIEELVTWFVCFSLCSPVTLIKKPLLLKGVSSQNIKVL